MRDAYPAHVDELPAEEYLALHKSSTLPDNYEKWIKERQIVSPLLEKKMKHLWGIIKVKWKCSEAEAKKHDPEWFQYPRAYKRYFIIKEIYSLEEPIPCSGSRGPRFLISNTTANTSLINAKCRLVYKKVLFSAFFCGTQH